MLIPPGDCRTKHKKGKKLNKVKLLRCLLDSGSTGNVLASKHVETYNKTKTVYKKKRYKNPVQAWSCVGASGVPTKNVQSNSTQIF